MPLPRAELFRFRLRRAVRWLLPAGLLAVAPKCVLCVLAYAGLGTALGLGGPEFCGGSAGSPGAWASSLAWFGLAGGLGALGLFAGRRSITHGAGASSGQ